MSSSFHDYRVLEDSSKGMPVEINDSISSQGTSYWEAPTCRHRGHVHRKLPFLPRNCFGSALRDHLLASPSVLPRSLKLSNMPSTTGSKRVRVCTLRSSRILDSQTNTLFTGSLSIPPIQCVSRQPFLRSLLTRSPQSSAAKPNRLTPRSVLQTHLPITRTNGASSSKASMTRTSHTG